jgi:signal transduction histidine kinase
MQHRSDIKVLIAEDNYLVSEMIKGSIMEIGYTIIGEAVDGVEAVELTRQLRPDVVLMDIEMPDRNGIEATKLIFASCPTPVVVLTAYETAELISQASEVGVGAYIINPPNPQEIERAITIAMARFDDTLALRNLNQTLKTQNDELDTFAHTISHNLQYSIDMIVGYANILKGQARLPDELEHYLNMIVRTSHSMTNVIRELELLSGVRNTHVEVAPLNMSRVMANAQQRLAHLIEAYHAKVVYPAAWPTTLGYAPWIEEVWVTYLSNALKYSGETPNIHVGATARSDGMVRFWVRDNGPGLSPEAVENIFTLTIQPGQEHGPGFGLGLSVVKRIIEKLGGQVGVETDTGSGQGNTFYFTLPHFNKTEQNYL